MGSKVRLGTGKVCTAEAAAAMVPSGATVTVSGVVGWMYPQKVIRELEIRYLTTNEPAGLTLFEPFPTGIPGMEPFAHPGFLSRVVGGWYTPHPRMCEMVNRGDIEAYLFPLGSLSFLCQQMAAGRAGFLTKVGLDTYLDPRNGGGKLNARTTDDLVSLETVDGAPYIWYRALPIDVALIRGTIIDEAGNLSLEDEAVTMSILYQAMAAKANGGIVIAQARKLVAEGQIHPRMVTVPGALVDHIVIDPDQHIDELNPDLDWLRITDRVQRPPDEVIAASNKAAWRQWVTERTIAPAEPQSPVEADMPAGRPTQPTIAGNAPVTKFRPITADIAVARRAAMEVAIRDFVNIGAGVASRDMLPVCIEERIDRDSELSMEGGILGGINNGIGFRANVTCTLPVTDGFSLYYAGLPSTTFLSMLEFDAQGNVNLLRYGDIIVGPGGSMDIAEQISRIVFLGTLKASGLRIKAEAGRLEIVREGAVCRAVKRVQAVCFNGPKMLAAGKDVTFITERASFRLTTDGLELFEIAPGIDLQRNVLDQMEFAPRVSQDLKLMDARIFTPGRMGLRDHPD